MNIGIDARMYGPSVGGGGLGRYIEQLVTQLQAIDHKNRYVLFLKKENFDACIITNPNFEKRLADVHWYTMEEQLNIGRIIDQENLDLVHFPHWNVPLFIRTPFVVTIHDLILLDEPFSSNVSTRHHTIFAVKYWAYKLVLAHAITRAQKVITVSHATADSILKHIEGVDPKHIDVVYEGVTALIQARTPISLPETPYLLYIGNAYPHKNLERLLQAFEIVRRSHPEFSLVLAGHDSVFYKNLLDHKPAGVIFVPNPTDETLSALYQNATAYVYPSRVEGFGLPPLEAMSAHVPVAASDIPSLREILGNAAAFFNPLDSHQIARVLNELIENPDARAEHISQGNKQITQYSWQKMASAILTIYQACGKKDPKNKFF